MEEGGSLNEACVMTVPPLVATGCNNASYPSELGQSVRVPDVY